MFELSSLGTGVLAVAIISVLTAPARAATVAKLGDHPTSRLTAYPALAALPHPVERISVYLPPSVALGLLPEIARAGAREVWFNPGAADAAVLAEAKRLGIAAIDGCSIVDLGLSPSDFP